MEWIVTIGALLVSGVAFYLWRQNQVRMLRRNPPEAYIMPANPAWSTTPDGPKDRTYGIRTAVNLRDLGGYPALDGKRIRWGLVYRSGTLNELSDSDVEQFNALGIRVLCDFRSHEEVNVSPEQPDRFRARYLHLPLKADRDTVARMIAAIFRPAQLRNIMLFSYTDTMFENNADLYGQVLTLMADPDNLPLLFHCTAGKDRTGMLAVLLLSLLGVPDEVIITDYTLSNRFNHRFREYVGDAVKPLKRLGLTVDSFYPLLIADGSILREVLGTLRTRYGSIESYVLSKTGTSSETINRLRELLLEDTV